MNSKARFVSIFWLLPILTSITSLTSLTHAATFPDISSPEISEAVEFLRERQIISGYPDGSFKPEQTINRAEALKIILSAFSDLPATLRNYQLPTTNYKLPTPPFSDTDPHEWYFPFVETAFKQGLINGYPDGSYRPWQTVNRVEFLKIALLAFPSFRFPTLLEHRAATQQFTDLDRTAWYMPYIAFALQHEFIEASKKFNPSALLTRGEAALIISRLLKMEASQEKPSETVFINNIDLTEYPWIHSEVVTIKNGKIFIGPFDVTDRVRKDNTFASYFESEVKRLEEVKQLEETPLEIKQQIDQLYPDLYARAIGIHGGVQDGKRYISWIPPDVPYLKTTYPEQRMKNKDGVGLRDCDCAFERRLVEYFSHETPFETWIKTEEAKAFIYDQIYFFIHHLEKELRSPSSIIRPGGFRTRSPSLLPTSSGFASDRLSRICPEWFR